jgi:hypothetical protein
VGQCLWEVAEEPLPARVVLLGEEADVVSEREQPLEQAARLVVAAEEGEVVIRPLASGVSVFDTHRSSAPGRQITILRSCPALNGVV